MLQVQESISVSDDVVLWDRNSVSLVSCFLDHNMATQVAHAIKTPNEL